MKRKLIMYVLNDITTDARVQRAATALASDFDVTLISTQKGKQIIDDKYINILVGGRFNGILNIFDSIFSAWKIIHKYQPDIVYCHDYYSAILAFFLIKTNCKAKIVYDAHELMIPETGRKDNRLKFFYWFEKRIVNKVDLLICANEERGEIMKKHYGLSQSPFVVPNISQLLVNDDDNDTKALLYSLMDFFSVPKYTVVYAGAVIKSRCVEELLDAAISLSDQCKLLIVGNGDALATLKVKAANHPELLSAFVGAVPYKSLGSILSRCDIGFLYYPVNTLNNTYCASNKIYEYASVGLPMVANENPTVRRIFKDSHIGLTTGDFKKGIILIASELSFYKSKCLEFTSNNQWSKEANNLLQKIEDIYT